MWPTNPQAQMTKSDSSENPQTPEATAAPTRLLDGIRSPADIKALREQDLPQLAQEVRDELIKVLSQTGGHLGPNLGVTELTIALHRVFDTPRDRFVMDVSHQGYVHKMFTGRLDRFHTMRQFGGLNGFLLRTESEHDCYGAGHAGTALSAALGMAAVIATIFWFVSANFASVLPIISEYVGVGVGAVSPLSILYLPRP